LYFVVKLLNLNKSFFIWWWYLLELFFCII